jgi:non-homologous end joining protein Ku
MKPSEMTEDGIQLLHDAMTEEEHAALREAMLEVTTRYRDLPPEEAVLLRRRDASRLVMEAVARVLGGSLTPQ